MKWKCPNCGRELTKDDFFVKYCLDCHSLIANDLIKECRETEKEERIREGQEFQRKKDEAVRVEEEQKEKNTEELLTCPVCVGKVAEGARVCPHCGKHFSWGLQREGSLIPLMGWIFSIIAGICFAVAIYYFLQSQNEPKYFKFWIKPSNGLHFYY
jgi:hypothetical protein